MSASGAFLLDTNVVLHATREGSPVSMAIDAQFGLSTSRFRPAICEVSVGELLAFSHSNKWGSQRRALLAEQIERCLVIPVAFPGVHQRWADMSSALRAVGLTVGQNDIWIAAAASVTNLTLLTTDKDFRHLAGLGMIAATFLDARTGLVIP